MTVNYTTNLSLGQPVTGTESGTWGDDVNNAVTAYLDIAIAGSLTVDMSAGNVTLANSLGTSTATNISTSTAQYAILNLTGAMSAARNLTVPGVSKSYIVNNNTTGGFAVTLKGLTTTGIALANGERCVVAWNGSDFAKISTNVLAYLSGILPVASGGTGVTTSTGTGSTVLSASPTFTGTPLAPTAATSTNNTQIATTAFVQTALQLLHPVGSIYTNASNATNPATLFGFGTWSLFSSGRVMVGYDGGTYPIGGTGGSADATLVSHTHTATASSSFTGAALAGHQHTTSLPVYWSNGGSGGITFSSGTAVAGSGYNGVSDSISAGTPSGSVSTSVSVTAAGSSATNANLQPYIVVYMWQRTA
jgi:hypothetical protein